MSELWARADLRSGGEWLRQAQEALDALGVPGRVALVESFEMGDEVAVGGYLQRNPCCVGGHEQSFEEAEQGLVPAVRDADEGLGLDPLEWRCGGCGQMVEPELWHRERVSDAAQPLGGQLPDAGHKVLAPDPAAFAERAERALEGRQQQRRLELEMRATRCFEDLQAAVAEGVQMRDAGPEMWIRGVRRHQRATVRVRDLDTGEVAGELVEGVSVLVDPIGGDIVAVVVAATLDRPEIDDGRLAWRSEGFSGGEMHLSAAEVALVLVDRRHLVAGANETARPGGEPGKLRQHLQEAWTGAASRGGTLSRETFDRLCGEVAVQGVAQRVERLQAEREPLQAAVDAYFEAADMDWLARPARQFVEEQVAESMALSVESEIEEVEIALEDHLGLVHLSHFGGFDELLGDLRAAYPDCGAGAYDAVYGAVRTEFRSQVAVVLEDRVAATQHRPDCPTDRAYPPEGCCDIEL